MTDAAALPAQTPGRPALVTGATGRVGHAILVALVERGHRPRALLLPHDRSALPPGVEAVRGDVTDPTTLAAAVENCDLVFNAMGIPEQWLADEALFDRVNAEGTANVVRAARAAGVRRLVHTSTVLVFDGQPGERVDESKVARSAAASAYVRSKQRAEQLALAERNAMDVVIVNPSGVYGPGPAEIGQFEDDLLRPLTEGHLALLPPGAMNIVTASGVAAAQLLASEQGRDGERYIVSDGYVTVREIARIVARHARQPRVPPPMPVGLARLLANLGDRAALITRRSPPLTKGLLDYLLWGAVADATKAQDELGWRPTPPPTGLAAALAALA